MKIIKRILRKIRNKKEDIQPRIHLLREWSKTLDESTDEIFRTATVGTQARVVSFYNK